MKKKVSNECTKNVHPDGTAPSVLVDVLHKISFAQRVDAAIHKSKFHRKKRINFIKSAKKHFAAKISGFESEGNCGIKILSMAGHVKFKFKSKVIGGETEKDVEYEWEVFAKSLKGLVRIQRVPFLF